MWTTLEVHDWSHFNGFILINVKIMDFKDIQYIQMNRKSSQLNKFILITVKIIYMIITVMVKVIIQSHC